MNCSFWLESISSDGSTRTVSCQSPNIVRLFASGLTLDTQNNLTDQLTA